ncbi:MAG: hypothetical protein PWR29_1810 [Methanolobus sp.]|nr:hypothetical protein [Methanolobus sp.]
MAPQRMDIFTDERAADALPMRFTAASIVLLAIVLLSATAVSDMLENERIRDAGIVLSQVDSHARMMSAQGEGSRVTLDIDVPAKMTIVLGGLPGSEDRWPEDARNHYIVAGSRHIVGESTAFYSNGDLNGTSILGPGKHRITLESVKRRSDNRIFVKVYES